QGRCEITQEGTTRRCRATARGARVAAAREGADTGAATLWRRALGVRALGAALRGPVGLGPTAGDEPGLPAGRFCGTLLDLPLAVGGQLAVARTRVAPPGRAAHEVAVARGACTVAVALALRARVGNRLVVTGHVAALRQTKLRGKYEGRGED